MAGLRSESGTKGPKAMPANSTQPPRIDAHHHLLALTGQSSTTHRRTRHTTRLECEKLQGDATGGDRPEPQLRLGRWASWALTTSSTEGGRSGQQQSPPRQKLEGIHHLDDSMA